MTAESAAFQTAQRSSSSHFRPAALLLFPRCRVDLADEQHHLWHRLAGRGRFTLEAGPAAPSLVRSARRCRHLRVDRIGRYTSVCGVTDFSGLAPDPHVVCARVAPLVGRPSAGMRRPYARTANLFRMCWAGLSRLYPIRLVQQQSRYTYSC